MNMIIIHTNFYKPYLISLRYLKADILQRLVNFVGKYNPTILCRTYRMIQYNRYIMTLMDIFAHISNMSHCLLRSKLRGIKP